MSKINIAIVGATGAVGNAMLDILTERNFPLGKIHALASARSAGTKVPFAGGELLVENLAEFDFSQVSIALFSAGGSVSAEYAPKAVAAGCIVIDNTSQFRRDDDVPLVIAEVNPEDIHDYKARGIIANPNCSTMQMLVALKPIHDAVGIERINVCTYQAVSGGGISAMRELVDQMVAWTKQEDPECGVYPHPIAFNVLPQIDVFMENDYTKEEMKMVWETQKIFHDPDIKVNPTAVRVPVFYGHSEAVHIEMKQPLSIEAAQKLLQAAPGVTFLENSEEYPTPLTHGTGTDPVYVGRLRADISHPKGLNMWVVADNVRKGAALNAIQIAELLLEKGIVK
jgi:aspartate-semialdehyde dehydrogenase